MIKIKICGLTRQEDIKVVNNLRPDYIGFVFAKSRRRVTPENAVLLKKGLDKSIKAVGVFVNEPMQYIVALCTKGVIDVVQLHGDESENYIQRLKHKITCPVIRAVRVQNSQQILQAESCSGDLLLLDTYQKGQYGGSGEAFDHSLIPVLKKPFILAGGLDYSNIRQAIKRCNPYGVDISSGVETDGMKDEKKIRKIIEIIRNIG